MVEKNRGIVLEGLAFLGRHGARAEEREGKQPFSVDLELQFPLPESDELSSTVDYAQAVSLVRALVESRSFTLIETLAQEIAGALLRALPLLERVGVRVHKPRAPLSVDYDDLYAECWLERGSLDRTGE